MKRPLLLLLLLPTIFPTTVLANVLNHQDNKIINNQTILLSQASFEYQSYNNILGKYVSDLGLVNYQELQKNRQELDNFNQSFAQVPTATYNSWNESEKIAFLLNAYNAFTLQSIIDQSPLKESIRNIPGVWKRRKFAIAGLQQTLDNIEHDILRKEFNEPRIHMALVCAAMSCPILRSEAYTANNLNSQLEDQTQKFVTSNQGLRIDRQKNIVYLSSIFKWFGQDWLTSYGINNKFNGNKKEKAVLNFVSGYLNDKDRQYLEQGNYKISYLKYDWSLNKQNN